MNSSTLNQTRTNRFNSKNSDNQRSKTPKQNNLNFGMNPRQSKSLVKPPASNTSLTTQNPPINFTKIMEPISQNYESPKYYYLGKGNNHQVIKRILSLRKAYVETTNTQFLHFKWTQNSFGFKYHKIGKDCLVFNHFQFHRQITNKQRLVYNMISFCQTNKLNAFTFLPVTYVIDLTTGEEDLALHSFLKFYNRNIPEGYEGQKVHSIILPRSKYMPYLSAQQLHKKSQGNFYCKPICPKTFFSQSGAYLWILKPTFMNRGRGVSLFSNLQEFQKLIWKYYEGEGLQDYENKVGIGEQYRMQGSDTVRIFTSPDDQEEEKVEAQKTQSKEQISLKTQEEKEKSGEKQKKQKLTPIKMESSVNSSIANTSSVPTNNSSIPTTANQPTISSDKKIQTNGLRCFSFVVQKYIQCPMLINQRKFDIRVWALLTQNYQVFFFKQGYLRFSSHKYSTDNHNNPFIHLTNNSVQKHCNQYNEQSGNQISLTQMKKYLPLDAYGKIQIKIRDIIWLSLCSVRRKINVNGRRQCFQLFGYDFMVDSTYKAWLIEVNTNPAIEQCSAILKLLIPRMLDDMFKLTLDKIFNPISKDKEIFQVPGFSNDQNMWQLLGDFKEGVNEKVMGKRLSFIRR